MATPTTLPAAFTVGQVLTSTQLNDLRGAFRVLQVVSAATSGSTSSTSATHASTGVTANITPSSNTSKVLVVANINLYASGVSAQSELRPFRGATSLGTQAFCDMPINSGHSMPVFFLDSPASTSALTYTINFNRYAGTGTVIVNINSIATSSIYLLEISA
jgi:hypothetical protein